MIIMDFETFKTKYLFEDKIYGQIFYKIKEKSSSIDFKLFEYGDDYCATCFFRIGELLDNPNSIEVQLNQKYSFIGDMQSFIIEKMRKLLGNEYYYNIDHNYSNVKVSIVLTPEDIENADDVLSKALSDKINEFLQSGEYVSQIKYKYEIYSNFYKLMHLDEGEFYVKNKIFYLLRDKFRDKVFSINDSFTYDFKLISSPNLQIQINLNASNSNINPNPLEKELMKIIEDDSTAYFLSGYLKDCVNQYMVNLLNSQKYFFDLVDHRLKKYDDISFVADLDNIDFYDVCDNFVYLIRQKILETGIPKDYFKFLDNAWNNYKKTMKNKYKFQKISEKNNYEEIIYKLNYLFSNDFNHHSFLDVGINTFNLIGISNNKIQISTKFNPNNRNFIFKSIMDLPNKVYELAFRKEYFFKRSKYTGNLDGDNLIIELLCINVYNGDGNLERALRNKLIESNVVDDDYLLKLDEIWKNKLRNNKMLEEKEKMLEAKKQKDREEFIKNNPYIPNKPINKDKFFK